MHIIKHIDSKGRLTLGKSYANAMLLIEEKKNGDILIKKATTKSEKNLFSGITQSK